MSNFYLLKKEMNKISYHSPLLGLGVELGCVRWQVAPSLQTNSANTKQL